MAMWVVIGHHRRGDPRRDGSAACSPRSCSARWAPAIGCADRAVERASHRRRRRRQPRPIGEPALRPATRPVARRRTRTRLDAMSLVLSRLASIDARLAQIEARLGIARLDPPSARLSRRRRPCAALTPRERAVAMRMLRSTPAIARAADGTLQVRRHRSGAGRFATGRNEPPRRPSSDAATASRLSRSMRVRRSTNRRRRRVGEPVQQPPREPSALSRWITGGNALTRVGDRDPVLRRRVPAALFRRDRDRADRLKLFAAGAGGVALAAIGFVLARARPAYGLSLQGAGMGIVYLTVFAAFRLYEVLSPPPAIALLVVVAATTVVLALRHDSQPLAALGARRRLPRAGPDSNRHRECRHCCSATSRVLNARRVRARLEARVAPAQRARLRVHVRARARVGPPLLHAFALRDRAAVPDAVLRVLRRHRDPVRAPRSARRAGAGRRRAGVRRADRRFRAADGDRARPSLRRRVERGRARRHLWPAVVRCCARARTKGLRCSRRRSPRWP